MRPQSAAAIVERLGEGMIGGRVLTEELVVPRTLHDHYSQEVAEASGYAYVECWDVGAQVEDVRAGYPDVPEAKLQAFGDRVWAIPDSVIRDTYVNATIKDGDREKAAALGKAIATCQQKLV